MEWTGQCQPGAELPEGVRWLPLAAREDGRGWLSEIFRRQQAPELELVQWNAVQSDAGVLRGVHVHVHHTDYVVLLAGRAFFGLRDLRPASRTFHRAVLLEASAASLRALLIPPGVAHGFFFSEPSMLIQGVTAYWDPEDELACSWADPALGIPWPTAAPALSRRDAAAGTLQELLDGYCRRAQCGPPSGI